MADVLNITPPDRYSDDERDAARLSLSKSRFFLVLGLAPYLGTPENPLPETFTTCPKPEFSLKIVHLERGESSFRSTEKSRLLLELSHRCAPKSRITTASRIVSAIGFLFTYVHCGLYGDLRPYQIPKELISGASISVELLEELEALVGNPYSKRFLNELSSYFSIAPDPTAAVFYLLPFVLQDDDLFNACAFFRSCCSDFSFVGGVVRDIVNEPRRGPENEIERLALEHVVLHSFRTIEAIVGEPGNNLKRFHQRLRVWNLEPNERVGFSGRLKHTLENRIRWLQDARDSAAAHGKRRRRRPFTLLEAMEAQHLANSVLDRALWSKAESLGRAGNESEVSFLLEEMFPHPGWSKDAKLFNGKRAVDLARTPGGLKRVLRYRERQIRDLLRIR